MATTSSNSNSPAPSLLKRLARENREMGPRLAQLEFREMMADLNNPTLFDLKIYFPGDPGPEAPPIPSIADDPVARRLPVLNVSIGNIAWSSEPHNLPVLGILCRDMDSTLLRPALAELMTAHHTKPFARFVFLCESLRPVPFLGRYKLTYEHIGQTKLEQISERLSLRFGISQILDLVSSEVLWRENDRLSVL